MARTVHMPWGWLILSILADDRDATSLPDIYASIEELYRDLLSNEQSDIINPNLLKTNLRYGDRPKYQHAVRSCLSAYRKQGLVERVAKGTYQLAAVGKMRSQEYQ